MSRMNDGFMRPTYPEQVIHSYYQASLVCELIERDFGADALGKMLEGYRDGLSTEQVFRQVLKTDFAAFDTRFEAFMQSRFAKAAASIRLPSRGAAGGRGGRGGQAIPVRPTGTPDPNDFIGQLVMGRALLEDGDVDGAIPFFERAKGLFPEYAGNDSPRWYLARIHKERGEFAKAAEELKVVTATNENHYQAHLDLADVYQALGDEAGAAAMLDRTMYIYPYDIGTHVRLATLYSSIGDRKRAVRERRAVIALNPVDLPEAIYQLAVALREAGDVAGARREVLRALEEAPNFEKAQTLLLALRRGSGEEDRRQP
jgi:tetratricopeptide (TPR) repeat protein